MCKSLSPAHLYAPHYSKKQMTRVSSSAAATAPLHTQCSSPLSPTAALQGHQCAAAAAAPRHTD